MTFFHYLNFSIITTHCINNDQHNDLCYEAWSLDLVSTKSFGKCKNPLFEVWTMYKVINVYVQVTSNNNEWNTAILLESRRKRTEKYKPKSIKRKIKVSSLCILLIALNNVNTDRWLKWKMREINEIWTLYLKHYTRTIPIFECLEATAAGKKSHCTSVSQWFNVQSFFANTHFLFYWRIFCILIKMYCLEHFRFASAWLHLCSFSH